MPMHMAYAQPQAYAPQGHRVPQQHPAYHPQMVQQVTCAGVSRTHSTHNNLFSVLNLLLPSRSGKELLRAELHPEVTLSQASTWHCKVNVLCKVCENSKNDVA